MRNYRSQFKSLLLFLMIVFLVLSNSYIARIFAQGRDADIYEQIRPMAEVLDEILRSYVREPDPDAIVEGAIKGMMNSLDEHSSFIPKKALEQMTEDTEGEFEGIGVSIHLNKDGNVAIFQPIMGSPAAKAGLHAGDVIVKINDVLTKGMSLDEARDLIRGPSGTRVRLTIFRELTGDGQQGEEFEVEVERGKIPLESISEARILTNGIGYIRVSDFKKTTAEEIAQRIDTLKGQGMKSLILDLRWNVGGLFNAAKEVAELFLPKGALVTYTKGRNNADGSLTESIRLKTQRNPILPESFPLVLLVNEYTASSAEIVTGALEYWSRAIVVGTKTYGKGSVQTIIPLRSPEGSALRLTTALYYTPADVTIDKQGILPDVEVSMTKEESVRLIEQMIRSMENDPNKKNEQNHGSVTGNEVTAETVEDVQLKRAVEILQENLVFSELVAKYHKDVKETQREASQASDKVAAVDSEAKSGE